MIYRTSIFFCENSERLLVNNFSAKKLHRICDALRDLVQFIHFKKREKHSSIGVFHIFKLYK